MNKKIAYTLALFTVFAFLAFIIIRLTILEIDVSFTPYLSYSSLIFRGFMNTIYVSVIALLGSLILGFIFYLLSVSKIKYFNAITDVFTEIIYGTPLLVLIVVMVFIIGPAFGFGIKRELMGITGLIVYMTPYMKNVYKSAISSISEEQYMAMDLFGFTPVQRYRYIIIPQVVRMLMPPMMNNFSMIIKGSALLNVISYMILYHAINIAQNNTLATTAGYLLMLILYLFITIPLSQLTKLIERKWAL